MVVFIYGSVVVRCIYRAALQVRRPPVAMPRANLTLAFERPRIARLRGIVRTPAESKAVVAVERRARFCRVHEA